MASPNYLGEMMIWWSLFLFGLAADPEWAKLAVLAPLAAKVGYRRTFLTMWLARTAVIGAFLLGLAFAPRPR